MDKFVASLLHQTTYSSLIGAHTLRNKSLFGLLLRLSCVMAILASCSIIKFNFYISVTKSRMQDSANGAADPMCRAYG